MFHTFLQGHTGHEWDNIMIMKKKVNKFLVETNFGSCVNVYVVMPSVNFFANNASYLKYQT